MTDIGQLITDFVQQDGIAVTIILFLGWFLTTRVWPFLTKEYWPVVAKREDERNAELKLLAQNLVELKNGCGQMQQLIERNYATSRERDELVLEGLAALHARVKHVPFSDADAAEVAKSLREIRKGEQDG